MATYILTPPAAIRLGDERTLTPTRACREVERAFHDGVTANDRAMRIMRVFDRVSLEGVVARAIARPNGDALDRDTHWQRCGGMARELHTAEARAAIAAIRSTIEADDACS